MEDGLEQHMSMLLQMREQQPKVEKKPVKVVTTTVIEEQVHPIGLSIVSPKTTSDLKTVSDLKVLITSTNSGS
jgi:methanogenic corrinoid protein MtbC1